MYEIFQKDQAINLHIIERMSLDDEIISATKVRKFLLEGKIDAIEKFVPKETTDFIKSDEGRKLVNKLKEKYEFKN